MGRKIRVSIFLPIIFLPKSRLMESSLLFPDLPKDHEPERSAAHRSGRSCSIRPSRAMFGAPLGRAANCDCANTPSSASGVQEPLL
jgi:hypothetical protein